MMMKDLNAAVKLAMTGPEDCERFGYTVDVALVIDATGDMEPCLERVKRWIGRYLERIPQVLAERGRSLRQLRVRVITFRDLAFDGAQALQQSRFFTLPQEQALLQQTLDAIRPMGGGDPPESALEALAAAMQSDWAREGVRRRHVVVLFSNADAVPLGDPLRLASPDYPDGMPADLQELSDRWHDCAEGGMPFPGHARLIAFVPQTPIWSELESWNNAWSSDFTAIGGEPNTPYDTTVDEAVGMMFF